MNIYLTLDYELFMGAVTGTPENCLIRPMNALCSAIEEYGGRFTIFVDAAYLLRLSQLKNNSEVLIKDFNSVVNNIKDLHQRGHDIELHFHPQWIYSNWDEKQNKWVLDYEHYKLSDMDGDPFISISQAKDLLDSIIGRKTIAFRAGGHCLESYNSYIDLFKRLGIVVDSSVLRGQYNLSPKRYFDYRKINSTRQIYNFSDSICEENGEGSMLEAPISFCKWSKAYYIFSSMRTRLLSYTPNLIYGDGISYGNSIERKTTIKQNRLLSHFMPVTTSATSSGLLSMWIMDVYKYAINKGWDNLVFIGHPKDESDVSIKNLKEFVSKVSKENSFGVFLDLTNNH